MAKAPDIYEQDARRRSEQLEAAGRLPVGFTAEHYPLTRTERLQLRRLRVAWELAGDLDSLHDLLLGVPVDPARLNKTAIAEAFDASLVQLVRPIDVLHGRTA